MSELFILPIITALGISVLISTILVDFARARQESKFRRARSRSFKSQFWSPKRVGRRIGKGLVKLDMEISDLANGLVRSKYRSWLQQQTEKAGASGDRSFRKMLRSKLYIMIVGLILSFLLSVRSNFQLLPITIGATILSYFGPNLVNSVIRISSSTYGKRISNLIAFQGATRLNTIKLFKLKFYSSLSVFFICFLYATLTQAVLSNVFYSILVTIFAFFVPDIYLYNKVMKRRELFEQIFPDAIDLLSMCVNSGLAFPAALAKVSESQKGPVAEELARVNAEVSLGKDRVEALREMTNRVKSDSLRAFVNSVSQVDRFGIPISRALAEQSRELRANRKALGREKAQKVPIKILGPIMLCFLPCVIIIVLAPTVIRVLTVL